VLIEREKKRAERVLVGYSKKVNRLILTYCPGVRVPL
jgi:hypothetical protein